MIYISYIKILSRIVEGVYEFDQLGATINDKLMWGRHVEKLYKTAFLALFSAEQVKVLPKSSLLTTYRSLVKSKLLYCKVSGGICASSFAENLQPGENRAI